MRGIVLVLLAAAATANAALVRDVRAAINRKDIAAAEALVSQYRLTTGPTPELILAQSWLGRAAVAAKQWDRAEQLAAETRKLATAELKKRPLDAEPDLPLALGAAIEVQSHVFEARGERSEAVAFLRRELETWRETSIRTRIQKNINLLSMEGKTAPALELGEWVGQKPRPLEAYQGKVTLLFLWAHWCGDCKRQGPVIERLLTQYGPRGLAVVAPTRRYGYVQGGEDAPPEKENPYIAEIQKRFYPWMTPIDIPLSEGNFKTYGVSTTPTLVLVDRKGIVRLYHPGNLEENELAAKIVQLLGS